MRAHSTRVLLFQHDNPPSTSPRPSDHTDTAAQDASANAAPVRFDSSSLTVTVLVLLSALFFLAFFSIYARRFCAADSNDGRSHRRHRRVQLPSYGRTYALPSSSSAPGLDLLALQALPLLSYSSAGKERQAGCVVCLSEFGDREMVKVIPGCGHVFHPDCIDAWLLWHGSCPLCRSTQLFDLSLGGEVRVDVLRRGGANEQRDGGNGTSVELVRETEVDVEVAVAAEGGGPEERRRQTGKKLRFLGRSDSWCCRSESSVAHLRRSRSL